MAHVPQPDGGARTATVVEATVAMDEEGQVEMLRFSVCGQMTLVSSAARIEDHDFGGVQLRLVTAALLLDPDSGWSTETLGAEVWPAGPPDRWRPAIRGLVSQTRKLLGDVGVHDDAIVNRGGRYVVEVPRLHTDLKVARDELAVARVALDDDDGAAAGRLAGSARAVLSRPILPGIDSPWVDRVRRTAAADHLDTLLVLGRARRRAGRWSAARAIVQEALSSAPYREDVYREAMRIEAQAGNSAAALQVYETCRLRLANDLGVDPSPATRELHATILRVSADRTMGRRLSPIGAGTHETGTHGAFGVGPGVRDHQGSESPYVGLRAFTQADVDRFFGREAATQQVLDLLARHRAVVVVGASGSGKSSLVRAGVLPALGRGAIPDADTWLTTVLTPGTHPLKGLATQLLRLEREGAAPTTLVDTDRSNLDAAAVVELVDDLADAPETLHEHVDRILESVGADARARLVIVIDQAEELVTLADADQAAALITGIATALRRADSRVSTIATLRADFYVRAATLPHMAHLLSRSQLVVPPMTGAELEEAIVGPARRVGAHLEAGVVARLLTDAAHRPELLPLLQHTLWELWHGRDGSGITEAAYDRLGGLHGALARHAEDAWSTLEHPMVGRRVLLRGVTARTGDDATRRPIHRRTLTEIAPDDQIDATLDSLVTARLLQADRRDPDTVYQLAHEALITHWPRLRILVEQQHAHLVTTRRIGTAADQWQRGGRARDWLLTGRPLDDAAALVTAIRTGEVDLTLAPYEEALVLASTQARAGRRAEQRVERACSRAELCLTNDPEAAVLLALAVVDDVLEHVPGRRDGLHRLLHRALSRQRLVWHRDNVGKVLDVAPDGATFVTAAHADEHRTSSRVDVHALDGEGLLMLPAHAGGDLPTAAYDADIGQLVTGDAESMLRWWDLARGTCQRTASIGHGAVRGLAVAAGSGIVAAWCDVDRTTGCLVIAGPDGAILRHRHVETDAEATEPIGRMLVFDPAGDRLLAAVADHGRTLELVEVATWEVVASSTLSLPIADLEWHPDGLSVAIGSSATAQVLDASTLKQVQVCTHAGPATVTWTPDGSRVAAMSSPTLVFLDRQPPPPETVGGPPVLVHTRTRGLMAVPRHVPGSDMVLMGASGHSAVDGMSVQLHDVSTTGPGEVTTLACGDAVTRSRSRGLSWSPDGDLLAVGRGDGELALVDTTTWFEVERWQAHGHRHDTPWPDEDGAIAWAPHGRTVASVGNDGTLTIHRRGANRDTTTRLGSPTKVWGWCGFTPDGQYVATLHDHVVLVRSLDGTPVARHELPPMLIPGAADLHPDGSTLAVTQTRPGRENSGADLVLWNWQSDSVRHLDLEVEMAQTSWHPDSVSWHPDGRTLALAGRHPDVRIVDVVAGRVVRALRGHSLSSTCVAHSPDGRFLASSGWDRTVRIWDLQTGKEVVRLDALTGPPGELAFHPARPWLAVVDWSGAVRVWTTDLDELVSIARSRVTRDLTDAERRAIDDGAALG